MAPSVPPLPFNEMGFGIHFRCEICRCGAEHALVLPPAYFDAGMSTTPVIELFFLDIAARGELIVVYNFPAVTDGINLDSDLLESLVVKGKGRILGVKLTCASADKITRLGAKPDPKDFAVFGGQSDFLLAGFAVGSVGYISTFGSMAPKAVNLVYQLWEKGRTGDFAAAKDNN